MCRHFRVQLYLGGGMIGMGWKTENGKRILCCLVNLKTGWILCSLAREKAVWSCNVCECWQQIWQAGSVKEWEPGFLTKLEEWQECTKTCSQQKLRLKMSVLYLPKWLCAWVHSTVGLRLCDTSYQWSCKLYTVWNLNFGLLSHLFIPSCLECSADFYVWCKTKVWEYLF